jgi:HAD superfamily hydrolase (TIGR01509 family)
MRPIYVFDLDGTLINSMSRYSVGILKVLDDAGIAYDNTLIKIITPLGYTKTAEYFIREYGLQDTVENVVSRIEKNLYTEYAENIELKPTVREYLEKLKSEGAALYVLTASPHLVTDVCLKRNGIYDLFDIVWSMDDFNLTKSDTRVFYKVAELLGCTTGDIHFFDDNVIALENGAKAGCMTYGVYDSQTDEEIEEIRPKLKKFIRSYKEMM